TRPKLRDPFQVVRMPPSHCRRTGRIRGSAPRSSRYSEIGLAQVESAAVVSPDDVRGRRTIANLWRNALAAGRPDPAYLHEVDGEWVEVSWAEAARAVQELANG